MSDTINLKNVNTTEVGQSVKAIYANWRVTHPQIDAKTLNTVAIKYVWASYRKTEQLPTADIALNDALKILPEDVRKTIEPLAVSQSAATPVQDSGQYGAALIRHWGQDSSLSIPEKISLSMQYAQLRKNRGADFAKEPMVGIAAAKSALEEARTRQSKNILEAEAALNSKRSKEREKLNAILENHKLWLAGEGGERASFRSMDMTRTDFSGADLRKADFFCAKLSQANFHGANLSGAMLYSTMLNDADFSNADLRGADLTGACANHTNFTKADLRDADFGFARIDSADFAGAKLYRTNMHCCNKSRATNMPAASGKDVAEFAGRLAESWGKNSPELVDMAMRYAGIRHKDGANFATEPLVELIAATYVVENAAQDKGKEVVER